MKKRFLILMLAFALVLSSIVSADATTINDINKSSSYAKAAIEYLASLQVISGDQNGNFNPQKSVTRAEMVALMAKAMNLDTSNTPTTATFKDVPMSNWAFKYVEAAYKQGIITGISATEFKPNDKITREQMAVIFVRALKLVEKDTVIELNNIDSFGDKAKISVWAHKEVEVAIEAGLMNGVSGSSFEPKTPANKEQSAVVIERLMKNKESIIAAFKEQIPDENAVKVALNNENVVLKNNILVQDSKIFVPIEFINKFILDATIYDIEENANTIELYPAPEFAASGIDVLWMQVGNNKAYKNLEEDPFTGAAPQAENTINLTIAPIQIEGKTYIALDELTKLLGMDYQYSSETNKLNIINIAAGKSPNLYFALKQLAYNDFAGEMRSKGEVKLTDAKTMLYSRSAFDMNDKQNDNYTVASYSKETTEISGQAPQVSEQQSITIDKKHYEKDFSDNKWVQTNLKTGTVRIYTLFYDPIFENEEIANIQMNATLFESLSKIDVKKEGIVYLSGVPATKYVMEFDINTIKDTMSEEDYALVKEFANGAFQGKLNYRYEFYVSNNNVIKQTFQFDGNTIDENSGNTVNYHSFTDIFYKNLGKKFVISAPSAADIKAVTN